MLLPANYGLADGDLKRESKLLFGSMAEKNPAEGAKLVEARAEEGYPWVNFYLGRMLEEGLGIEQSDTEAYWAYYEAAAVLLVAPKDAGGLAASKRLGLAWWNGDGLGLRQSDEQAGKYLRLVLAGSDAKVNYLHADALARGTHDFPYNVESAEHCFTIAARDEESVYGATAEGRLAELYFVGEGIEQNMTKAAEHARKAAERGDARGMVVLAYLNRAGVGGFAKDPAKSVEWMKASAEKGAAAAKSEMAKVYDGLLKGAMVKGDRTANPSVGSAIGAFRVSAMYAEQEGVTPMSNYLMALGTVWDPQPQVMRKYLVAAADGGITDTQIEVAYQMWAGTGGPVDRAGGLKYMEMAAKTDANAMYALGAVMANGLNGVPADKTKAEELLTAAAGMGQGQAVKMMAFFQ